MQIAGVGIIAFVVYEVSQFIFTPGVDGALSGWGDKQRLALVMLLCCALGVVLALAINANMLVGVQGIDPTPFGAVVLTGIIAGFGSGAVEQVAALGKGATQIVVGTGQTVLAKGKLLTVQAESAVTQWKLQSASRLVGTAPPNPTGAVG